MEIARYRMETRTAYDTITAYFSQPGAVLAQDEYGGACHYRDAYNPMVRCAVGCLIPDAIYSEAFEGQGIHALLDEENREGCYAPELAEFFAGVEHEFLDRVQRAHDESKTVEEFLGRLRIIGAEYELNSPSPELVYS